jgi:hypothetical protein
MATCGRSEGVASTSALTLKPDIQLPMSVFVLISSGSPPEADVPDGVAE